jgi:precorrin-8X/cobalt-precorrin-8 methylmutase
MYEVNQPQEIERLSFELIRSEIGEHHFTPEQLTIAVRVIHATADFDFVNNLSFHPQAVHSGIQALREGGCIVTDVKMVYAGISQKFLDKTGASKVCDIQHPAVIRTAKAAQETRAIMSMRRNADLLEGGIAAIGNAPTALFEVIRLVKEQKIKPALIVGVPVGFINTVESKEALRSIDTPYITSLGRKGGSSVAVAIINALLHLAAEG